MQNGYPVQQPYFEQYQPEQFQPEQDPQTIERGTTLIAPQNLFKAEPDRPEGERPDMYQ